jgi:5-methylcytosine-specific restriction protein A
MIKDGDWNGAVKKYVERARNNRITHLVFIVRDGLEITHAALLPISELAPIWRTQRKTFNALIKKGRLGKSKRNPADNGSSPTLWLVNDEAQEAVDALWNHRGVQDIANIPSDKFIWQPGDVVILQGDEDGAEVKIPGSELETVTAVDDTFDDLPGFDSSLFGSDGAPMVLTRRSYVKRDPRVRANVLRRANGKCERKGCEFTRSYSGFFDVHHILGASKSDRVYNCVALCPNSHRDAHFATDRDEINQKLLAFARKFRASSPQPS